MLFPKAIKPCPHFLASIVYQETPIPFILTYCLLTLHFILVYFEPEGTDVDGKYKVYYTPYIMYSKHCVEENALDYLVTKQESPTNIYFVPFRC